MEENILVHRLREGDPKVIDEVVEEYKRPLFAFILRMVGNPTSAEDIFQETWLRVIRHIRSFRGDSKFSTWLFQIAVNLCRDAERKKKRWFHVPIEEHEHSLYYEPEFGGIRMMKTRQVRKIISSLPFKMREVIILRYYHDLNDKEIAKVVGCPVGTVKSRYYRAAEIIRRKWDYTNRSSYK